jgi:hypothetical protein
MDDQINRTWHGWRKSTRSGTQGNCVQVRIVDGGVEVRDSKDPAGPVLRFTRAEWLAFLDGAKGDEFDLG